MQGPIVEFDEGRHKYSIDGVEMKRSVTETVHLFFPEFNAEEAAAITLRGSAGQVKYRSILGNVDPRSQEARDLVKTEWDRIRDDAATKGTAMHKAIEEYYRSKTKVEKETLELSSQSTKEFEMFRAFNAHTIELGYRPFASEQIVFDLDLSLAGSVDMLYSKNEPTYRPRVWMVDWKRSREIKTTAYKNETGYFPLHEIPNCNLYHYRCQLNLYKWMLEKNHGIEVERMTLVILHPQQDEYIALEVPDMQELITDMIEHLKEIR